MKKTISIVLAIVMIMAVAITAFAAENACTHNTSSSYVGDPWIKYEPYNGGCRPVTYAKFPCAICGELVPLPIAYGQKNSHSSGPYAASCNGTTQTLLNRCTRCGVSMASTTQRCPGGPHTGNCRWLPA